MLHYFMKSVESSDADILFVVRDGFVNRFKKAVSNQRKLFHVWNVRSVQNESIDFDKFETRRSQFRIVIIDQWSGIIAMLLSLQDHSLPTSR
jgi:histidinol phosphatase-like enzyme